MPGTPVCTLRCRQPTSSTIYYVVSTRGELNNWPLRVLHSFGLLFRLAWGIATLLLIITKLLLIYPDVSKAFVDLVGDDILQPLWITQVLTSTADEANGRYLIPIGSLLLYVLVQRGYTEESLLVLRGLGIQVTSSSPTYFSTATSRFIPTTSIQDIFIHEAFKGFEVRFYLAIVVDGEQEVVVVFPKLLPSLTIIEEVWRGARGCLFEPKT